MSGLASILRLNGQMVGTVTYYPQPPSDSLHPATDKAAVGYFGQLAVSRSAQGSGLGARLLDWVEQKAAQDGKREIACDTAEGALHLVAYYTKRGYRCVGYQQWPHAVYRSVILSKHLKEDGVTLPYHQ
jgi:GNAT superfamily N-acetyltransferase